MTCHDMTCFDIDDATRTFVNDINGDFDFDNDDSNDLQCSGDSNRSNGIVYSV